MKKVGIVGVNGFGGTELLRLCLGHPHLELAYVAGESSAGFTLGQRFPALAGRPEAALVISPFEPETAGALDLLFVSMPTGRSREPLARVPPGVAVLDVGGDHRFAQGWTYGLTELPGQRQRLRGARRVANPGCFPAAALLALAPLLHAGLVEPDGLVIDAKSGVTGTGRGAAGDFGYVATNESLFAYGLQAHPHLPEIERALSDVAGSAARVVFTPHLVPMSRGILATCYARPRGAVHAAQLAEAAAALYDNEPFVKLHQPEGGRSAITGWTRATNLALLSYTVNPGTGWVVALAAIDNLGKGASGQAVQNANLMLGLPETAGLTGAPVWP
jgi:N-acetyl-gamma-glutamyl-phosphate reductase